MSFYTKNLRDEEQIIAIIKRNWVASLPKYILAFILFFIPFFFMFPILNWGIWGQILLAVLLAIALFYLIKLLVMAYFNCLVITTQRIIDFSQIKIFEREVKEAEFINIAEVSYKLRNLLHYISRSANLEIKLHTSPDGPPLIIKNISRPEKVQNLILDLKRLDQEEKNIKQKQDQARETYQEILNKIKNDVGQDGLERLLRSLDDNPAKTNPSNSAGRHGASNKDDKDLEFLK